MVRSLEAARLGTGSESEGNGNSDGEECGVDLAGEGASGVFMEERFLGKMKTTFLFVIYRATLKF